MAKKEGAIGPILFLALAGVAVLYYFQSGPPDASGLQGIETPGAGEIADGAAEGARQGADKVATDIGPWIARHGTIAGAAVVGLLAMWFWKKYKVLSIIALTAAIVGVLVMMAQ